MQLSKSGLEKLLSHAPHICKSTVLKLALGSNLFHLNAGETSAHHFHSRFTSRGTLGAGDRKKSRQDMGELAGGSGRWWRSVRRSHGDVHHRDVAHNVVIKSLCTDGFSCIEVIRSPQEVCVVPIKRTDK